MLTDAAIIPTGFAGLRGLPFGWEFVVVVILLILLFYIRVHGPRNGSRQKTGHRSGRRTARHAVSRRRPNRP